MKVEEQRIFPSIDRLSVLAATILLAYALTRYINMEPIALELSFLGIQFSYLVDIKTVVSFLVALLAASGSDWLIRNHPAVISSYKGWKTTVQHWILPALTAWIIGVPLNNLAASSDWWIIFVTGGLLLVFVFIAEYSVVDVTDVQHPFAAIVLTALSFSLYLILAIAIRSADLRLYLVLPALVVAIWLVSLRTLYLRLGGRWLVIWATVVAIAVGQIAMAIHYWPVSPTRYGLILLGPGYALTSLAGAIEEHQPFQKVIIEPLFMLLLIWGLAFWLG
jgi:hypothetical protein